jgi:hypothetical protein
MNFVIAIIIALVFLQVNQIARNQDKVIALVQRNMVLTHAPGICGITLQEAAADVGSETWIKLPVPKRECLRNFTQRSRS